jgi:hypothetical protein
MNDEQRTTITKKKFMKKTVHKEKSEPVLHVNENLNQEEQVAERAHELYNHGNDLADWFQAEREIHEWHQRKSKTQASHNSGAAPARP